MTTAPNVIEAPRFLRDLEVLGPESVQPSGGAIYRAVSRAVDVLIASVLLVLVSPVMLLAALLIKLSGPGPIIFRQQRAGRDGQPFTMFKFRSMRIGAEEDREYLGHLNTQGGPVFKVPDDPRLIWCGKFLRRSSIDELPQLFNVLLGQMALVGPRPLWLPEAQQTRGIARRRTSVKPGLTCLWQVLGRSELSYEQWVLLDLYYIRHRSILLDLLIIIQTVPAVLSGHGAY